MEMLKTQLQLLVGVALSLVAIGIATLYLYSSRKKNTASSQVRQEKYDVFISFRGSDIRHGFLSHLTKRLRDEGIDVYVDERLNRGDKISSALMEAIEKSTLALVIFSKDYASSTWCLEELEKIRECKRVKNQIVVPIFYNVDPSHVRHQEGSYADAFAQHKQKFKHNLKKLLVWKSILKETANLSGFHSSNFLNESDLIDEVIKDVLKKLEDTDIIEPKWLIGFEEHLAIIESFMKDDSQEVTVLGIWGKGGIGKTTLARAIFDKFSKKFDSCCFVSKVREQERTSLLEKILTVLLNDENLTMKGSLTTQRRLRRMKVLLVLDDVNTSSQLQYLVEENLSLGPDSKVIITSRDRHVFTSGEVHVVHEVKELNEEESLQLFCRHAFKQTYPKVGYEKLSAQAIQYAAGLPLALKILGLHLKSRNTKKWESELKKLRKYPNVEIQNALRVSYEGLDIPEKRLFLDIAFFFRGEKQDDIIRVLDACDDLYIDCGMDSLIDKALITISRDGKVEIHDLLQEMAEEIVREDSREHPERRSRLNDVNEIQDILENSKGTDAIEGIILNLAELKNDLYVSAGTFEKMRNLRFLKFSSHSRNYIVRLSSGQESFSNKLRYFFWRGYPMMSLPLGFCPQKLVEIRMPFSRVVKLWDGVQDLRNLKIINLIFCQKLQELPDFSMAQNLEMVDLGYCQTLCSIHPSILSLPKLVSLRLMACVNLENLHGENHLKSLVNLELNGCQRLKEFLLSSEEMRCLDLYDTGIQTMKLPIGRFNKLEALYLSSPLKSFEINELRCLTSLKIFSLSYFEEVIDKSNLAILFDAWRSLEKLQLIHCWVTEIPYNINDMSLLKILSLKGCRVESLPDSIKHLSELNVINLCECQWLKSLPELPPSITRLYANGCILLETFINFRRTMDGCNMEEFIHFSLMRAIYNNECCEVRVCHPGSIVPKGFKYFQMGQRSITIELAPPSSANHLLGFASFCILFPLDLNPSVTTICRKFHFEDEEINYKDERHFPGVGDLKTDHIYLWYDPMESVLKGTQRRRYDDGTTHKFACEFFIGNYFRSRFAGYDHFIKGCGIWPIYASHLQEMVQHMELKKEGTEETEMPESFNFIQRLWNLRWHLRANRS